VILLLSLLLMTAGALAVIIGATRSGARLLVASVALPLLVCLVLGVISHINVGGLAGPLWALLCLVALVSVVVGFVRFLRHRRALSQLLPERPTSLKRRVDPGP
jgi:hypothetical protein